jgi:hypothetical protein
MRLLTICILIGLTLTDAMAQSVPTPVEQRVRQIYADKYPDNFSMQKTLIEDQLESYRFI